MHHRMDLTDSRLTKAIRTLDKTPREPGRHRSPSVVARLSAATTLTTPAGAAAARRVPMRDDADSSSVPAGRTTRRIVGTVAASLVIAAGGAWLGASGAVGNTFTTTHVAADRTVVSGCVIRFSDAGGKPSIYANGSHLAAGCKSVSITPEGRLRVTQTVDDPKTHPILFAFAQADETLNARGISLGASGGTGKTEYTVFDARLGRQLNLAKPADLARLEGKNSNAWLGWVHVGGTR